MGDVYYERYPGDYARDTRRLSLAEHGAYTLLLDDYYSPDGGPLPAALEALYRVCGCQDEAEREAVKSVAMKFFPVRKDDGLRHNKRADKQLAGRVEFLAEQSRKARLGAAARWSKKMPDACPTQSDRIPDASLRASVGQCPEACPEYAPPSPSPSPSLTPTPHAPPNPLASATGFEDFWNSYPAARRIARESALRAWVSVVTNGEAPAIMAALAWQVVLDDWTRDGGRYVPKPENYLWEKRWTDEKPPPAKTTEQLATKKIKPFTTCTVCGWMGKSFVVGYCPDHAPRKAEEVVV
jgi:uncharacterized protein YdaU (DUF1376 family)